MIIILISSTMSYEACNYAKLESVDSWLPMLADCIFSYYFLILDVSQEAMLQEYMFSTTPQS